MAAGWRRASFALASTLLLIAGLIAVFANATQSSATHGESQTHVIDIGGEFYEFNPPSCTIHRGDAVRWRNVSDEPRQIVVLGTASRAFWEAGNWVPYESDIIPPGGMSGASGPWRVNEQTVQYFDPTHPEIPNGTFRVSDGGDLCTQVTPTPTPTPSPTPSPTPTASPTPSVTPTAEPYERTIPNAARDGAIE